jgi:protein-L-isoaspartate(D-aspartate) O-methyltransferase
VRLEDVRRAYAEEIAAVAHLESRALVEAYTHVPREAFLGPGPWQIARQFDAASPYRTTADGDPRHIYHDVVVAIDPARLLNNGQPSALARWIEAAAVGAGDAVLHVGCGTGYYTAILAELVGPAGRVLAYEVDPDLAARARANLAAWRNAEVAVGDAAAPPGAFAAIFINAGCTHARPAWLAALAPGGRLVLPLTVHVPGVLHGVGVVLQILRPSAEPAGEEGGWPARVVSQVGIYDCAGARDPAREAGLVRLASFAAAARIRAVSIEPHAEGEACLAHGDGFCLRA